MEFGSGLCEEDPEDTDICPFTFTAEAGGGLPVCPPPPPPLTWFPGNMFLLTLLFTGDI